MKIYCQKCGSRVEFSANSKPKFCHNCGASLNLGSNVINATEEGLDEEEPDATSIPVITKLEVEMHTEEVKGVPLGNLIGTAEKGAPPMNINRPKQNRKEVLENFSKEAGALREKKPPRKTPKKTPKKT